MKSFSLNGTAFGLLLVLLFGVSCSKDVAPPAPLTAEELPATFEKAFAKAKPEAKDLATQVVASVQAKDFAKAHAGIQSLASMSGLNKEQMSIATRGMLTINTLLQEAQAQGDAKAAQALKTYRVNK